MPMEWTSLFGFSRVEGRRVVSGFDGGAVSLEARARLLGVADRAVRLVERYSACFTDARRQASVTHSVAAMVAQRVFAIELGHGGPGRSRRVARRSGHAGPGGTAVRPLGGQTIDASLVAAPRQRNNQEEKDAIKAGKGVNEIWPGQPAKGGAEGHRRAPSAAG